MVLGIKIDWIRWASSQRGILKLLPLNGQQILYDDPSLLNGIRSGTGEVKFNAWGFKQVLDTLVPTHFAVVLVTHKELPLEDHLFRHRTLDFQVVANTRVVDSWLSKKEKEVN